MAVCSDSICAGRGWRPPARHVFAAVLMLGNFLNIALKVSLPLAMTAMVRNNSTAGASDAGSLSDSCHLGSYSGHPTLNSSTTSPVQWKRDTFDWDEVTQSTIQAASGYGFLASCVVGARLAELWSRKYVSAISSTLFGLCFMMLPLTTTWNVAAVVAVQVLSGLFVGPTQPVLMAMTASWFPAQERQKLSGITASSLSLATMVSNLVTGKLADTLGWKFVFYFFSSLVLAWVVLWMLLVHDSPDHHPSISEEERRYITEGTKKDESQAARYLPWKHMLLSAPLWAHIVMGLPTSWVMLLINNSMPSYMTTILNFSSTEAGYFLALPQLLTSVCYPTYGSLSQWVRRKMYFGHRTTYIVFNGVATIGPAAVFLIMSRVVCDRAAVVTLLAVATTLSSAYTGGSFVNHMDLAVNYAATLSGMSFAVQGLVSVLAPTVTGIVTNNQQTLSAWRKVFYVAAGMNIVPFIIYLMFGSVEEQPWNRYQGNNSHDSSKSQASTADEEAQPQK